MNVDQKGSKPGPIISEQPQAEGVGGKKADLEILMQMNQIAAETIALQTGKDPKNVTLQEAIEDLRKLDQQAEKPS